MTQHHDPQHRGDWKQSTKTKTQAHAEAEFPETEREEEDRETLPTWKVRPSNWDKHRNIRIPTKPNEDLAEETGIHIGDGALSMGVKKTGRHYYWHRISGSIIDDRIYLQYHVLPLIQKLYNVPEKARINESQHEMSYVYESRAVAQFKSLVLGLPAGKKIGITMPTVFTRDSKLIRACIKGITDTDGTVTFHKRRGRHRYPQILIKNSSRPLIEQMADLIEKELGVNTSLTLDKLYQDSKIIRRRPMNWLRVNGEEALQIWMKKIGLANPSHLSRLMVWKKYGVIPPYTTFPQRVAMIAGEFDPHIYYERGKAALPEPTKISQQTLINVLRKMRHQYGEPKTLPSLSLLLVRITKIIRNEMRWSRLPECPRASISRPGFEFARPHGFCGLPATARYPLSA